MALAHGVALEAVGGVRWGTVSDAGADLRVVGVGGGVVVPLVRDPSGPWERWGVAVAGDALALGQSVRRGDATEARWILGAQVRVEGAWFFSERVGVVGAVAEEIGFGATRVFVGPERVATLSPFQTVLRLGLQLRF
ncbi:hypothetical protein [Pendulispora albinea]|uniref:hypothetical protein n=1 Tax=Pendulispora albinea TaxID=2741071 RepID=UPI00374E1D3D